MGMFIQGNTMFISMTQLNEAFHLQMETKKK